MPRRTVPLPDLNEVEDEGFDPRGFQEPAPVSPPSTPAPSFVGGTDEGGDDDLSFLQGEGWVRISRVSDQGETLFIRKMERKVLGEDIAFIGRTWGGGRYWLEVQNANRQWVKKRYVNFDSREYGPAKGAATPVKTDPKTGSPIIIEAAGHTTDPLVAAQLAALQKSQDAKDAEIRSLNERVLTMQSENNKAMMDMVMKIVAQPKPDPMADLQRLAAVRDLFGGNTSGGSKADGLAEVAKLFLPQLAEVVKDWRGRAATAGPAPENSSPLERMVMPFIEAFVPVLARGIAQQGTAPKPPLRRSPGGAPVPPAPATGQHPPVNGSAEGGESLVDKIKAHPMVKMIAPSLLGMVKNGTSVEDAAEMIADLVPDRYWPVVVQLVNREDMVEYLSIFEPDVVQHRAWLTALADTLKRDYIEDDEESAEPDDQAAPVAGAAPATDNGAASE